MADSQAARPLHPIVTLDYRVRMVKPVDRERVAGILAAYRTGAVV